MFSRALKYITEHAPEAREPWTQEESNIQIVLTHPNGWKGPQQAKMREAAVLAELVPDTDAGHERVHFVSEGEASFHSCVLNGLIEGTDEVGVTSSSSSHVLTTDVRHIGHWH